MNVKFFCPVWGLADMPMDQMIEKIKNAGYDGIEFGFSLSDDPDREKFLRLIEQSGLLTIAQLYGATGNDFNEYKESYHKHLDFLCSFRPLFINSHTGKDHYTFEQNMELVTLASGFEKESGMPVMHETHRGRFPYCISATVPYLKEHPDLKLAADLSHFCTVSESYLQDQQEGLHLVLQHSHHLHARVGHPQGPQVTDPRLPEWQEAVEHHLAWWDIIIKHHQDRGTAIFTITPEFGPAPYMPAAPFTQSPLASQWEINLYMMQLLRKRYH